MAHGFRVFYIIAELHSYSLIIISKQKGKVNSETDRNRAEQDKTWEDASENAVSG